MKQVWRAAALAWLMSWTGVAGAAGPLFLWEVRDAEGSLRAWLFGTVHVCDGTCFPLPRPVHEALGAADGLALELDPNDPAVQRRLLEMALLPDGTLLDAQLPPELRPRLARAVTQVGLPPEAIQRMRPWMAFMLLTLRASEMAGLHSDQGVDLSLVRMARAENKPLWSLESVDRQIAALSGGGDAAQVGVLREVVELIESGKARDYFQRTLDAWRRGDAMAMDRLMREEFSSPETQPLMVELLDRRNREMADRILRRVDEGGRPFVAVGAGHLTGPTGLLAEIGSRGYRLQQVVDETPDAN